MNHKHSTIVLIIPPYIEPDPGTVPLVEAPLITEPLGLESIAASLRKAGNHVKLLHCQLDEISLDQAVSCILHENPDIVGISLNFLLSEFLGCKELADSLRKNHYAGTIVTGGVAATFLYKEILTMIPSVDCVCLGESEQTMVELALNVMRQTKEQPSGVAFRKADRVVYMPRHNGGVDLDAIPFSHREILRSHRNQLGTAQIESSRGCSWGKCKFCSVKRFHNLHGGKIWKLRSIRRTIDEIEMIVNSIGITHFEFVDDNFIGPGK